MYAAFYKHEIQQLIDHISYYNSIWWFYESTWNFILHLLRCWIFFCYYKFEHYCWRSISLIYMLLTCKWRIAFMATKNLFIGTTISTCSKKKWYPNVLNAPKMSKKLKSKLLFDTYFTNKWKFPSDGWYLWYLRFKTSYWHVK